VRADSLRKLAAAYDGRTSPAIVDVVASIPLASPPEGIPIRFLRPGTFFKLNPVVLHDGALAVMEVRDGLVVFRDGRPERVFCQSDAALRVEHEAKVLGLSPDAPFVNLLETLQFLAGGNQAVGVILNQAVVGVDVSV